MTAVLRKSFVQLVSERGCARLSESLANLFASKFIARSDVKAIQYSDGTWAPHTVDRKRDSARIPWRRQDLEAHLAGKQSFGHYMLKGDDTVKLFAFDIDLEKNSGPEIAESDPRYHRGYWVDDDGAVHPFDAREAWLDRSHPSRNWNKYQLRMVSHRLAAVVSSELEIPCAVAYSGGKGVHVYAFTGLISAADARDGAAIALDTVGGWKPSRGDNFFRSIDTDPVTGYPNLSIEVFPKQDSLAGKDLGNLMRLPLGKNLKNPKDPTFFIDMTAPMGVMAPVDPVYALTTQTPWKKPNE